MGKKRRNNNNKKNDDDFEDPRRIVSSNRLGGSRGAADAAALREARLAKLGGGLGEGEDRRRSDGDGSENKVDEVKSKGGGDDGSDDDGSSNYDLQETSRREAQNVVDGADDDISHANGLGAYVRGAPNPSFSDLATVKKVVYGVLSSLDPGAIEDTTMPAEFLTGFKADDVLSSRIPQLREAMACRRCKALLIIGGYRVLGELGYEGEGRRFVEGDRYEWSEGGGGRDRLIGLWYSLLDV